MLFIAEGGFGRYEIHVAPLGFEISLFNSLLKNAAHHAEGRFWPEGISAFLGIFMKRDSSLRSNDDRNEFFNKLLSDR